MSAKYWKLAITSLSPGSTSAREAVVEGENWLAALRAARKALGEEGAVPPGASCVMSSSGEVTILDAAQRLRYLLTRADALAVEERPQAPLPPVAAQVSLAQPAATIADSAEESAAREQPDAAAASPAAAPTPDRVAAASGEEPAATQPAKIVPSAPATAAPGKQPGSKPAFSPARPTSRPPPAKAETPKADPRRPIPAKRNATIAYSPGEAAQLRREIAKAEPAAAPETTASRAETNAATAPSSTAAASVNPPAQPAVSVNPPAQPTASVNPPPERAATSSSPAQPAANLNPPVQLDAASVSPSAQPAANVNSRPEPAAEPSPPAPQAAPSAAAPTRPASRRHTITYSPDEAARARARASATQAGATAGPKPAIAGSADDHLVESEVPSMLITLGHRDEEPSTDSPLTYRERSYYWPPPTDRSEVERALRAELAKLRKTLSGRARGQYVNLAVFDHAFGDKPERPPVATLQWKDWRGEPAFTWLEADERASWSAPQPGQPITSSFYPGPASTAPSGPPVPARSSAPGPMRAPTRRESTGEQDLRLAVAFEAVQDLYFLATPADGLDFAVKLLAELVPAEAISGCIYDINTDEFRFVALTGAGASERRADAVRSKQGLFGVAAHGGRDSLIVPDVMNEPRFDQAIDGRTGLVAHNMAFFVLHKADQLLGMLQLINREGGQAFREADLAVASYVANQMTAFLREKRGLSRSRG